MAPAPPAMPAANAKPLVSHRVSDSPPTPEFTVPLESAATGELATDAAEPGSPSASAAAVPAILNGRHAAAGAAAGGEPQQAGTAAGETVPQCTAAAPAPAQPPHGNSGNNAGDGGSAGAPDNSADTAAAADTQELPAAAAGSAADAAAASSNAAAGSGPADTAPGPFANAVPVKQRGSNHALDGLHGGTPSSMMSFDTMDSSSAPGRCNNLALWC